MSAHFEPASTGRSANPGDYSAPSYWDQVGHKLGAGGQNLVGMRQTVCSTVGGDISDCVKGGFSLFVRLTDSTSVDQLRQKAPLLVA